MTVIPATLHVNHFICDPNDVRFSEPMRETSKRIYMYMKDCGRKLRNSAYLNFLPQNDPEDWKLITSDTIDHFLISIYKSSISDKETRKKFSDYNFERFFLNHFPIVRDYSRLICLCEGGIIIDPLYRLYTETCILQKYEHRLEEELDDTRETLEHYIGFNIAQSLRIAIGNTVLDNWYEHDGVFTFNAEDTEIHEMKRAHCYLLSRDFKADPTSILELQNFDNFVVANYHIQPIITVIEFLSSMRNAIFEGVNMPADSDEKLPEE